MDNYRWDIELEGLPTQEVYKSYVQWCPDNGYKPMNSNNLGKEVRRVFPNVTLTQPCREGSRVRIYSGLTVRDQDDG